MYGRMESHLRTTENIIREAQSIPRIAAYPRSAKLRQLTRLKKRLAVYVVTMGYNCAHPWH